MWRSISTPSVTRVTLARFDNRLRRCASGWVKPLAALARENVLEISKEQNMKRNDHSTVTGAWRAKGMNRGLEIFVLVLVTLLLPKPANAARLGTDIIALFPKEVGEFAYADLKKARTLPWFPQLQEQMLPDRFKQFEKFLASAGVDPNTQVDELAWGLGAEGMSAKTEGKASTEVPTGEEIVGVALGTYNPNSTEAFFKQQKLPTFKARGYTLYAFGTGSGAN